MVEAYLILFTILHNIMKIFPVKRKVTFIMSYGENLIFIYDEMKRQKIDYNVVFLYKPTCKYEVDSYSDVKSYKFETKNIFHTIKSVYHLSTSKYVIIDNYFGSLAKVNFKKGVQCIQIWHAAGAIKKFGVLAPSFNKRSLRAQKRFFDVYKNFHKIVVGSDALANIYKDAFVLSDDRILKTGIPRTDLFFYEQRKQENKENILLINPSLKGKKVILYAPTFRDKELVDFDLHLDIDTMYKALKDEYIILIKLHPAVRNKLNHQDKYKDFVYDYSLYPNINDLFLVTDILITDYSSVPFEFCLLNKPMVFFPYDLKKYAKKRGIIGDYKRNVPGPVVYNTNELIDVITKGSFDTEVLTEFKLKWNQYSLGNSSEKLVNYLFNS
ncbi:CDP-glycerol--glycerophosphate glycerophosphotransferase [Bacillus cereus]|nr:CDP-glycerol--glycerophosphate glycerophosphotransferase [Bacillus cereus]PFB13249.1 CDP-glycerol--glycerophosphate glycerophosphotransferase [Bacillus cereus]PFK37306.1 CDP-glycerol--glycerophosphate glycerophosphotransferase [Bacillus cereus]PFN04074.1 CDP-glycerol--glycerophosphate glycerophosphotransferase [Bacillus cereus]PFR20502.1 CDP-glycerol--glycerophosphate glycerophosphotransferase [Bacillus cereus]